MKLTASGKVWFFLSLVTVTCWAPPLSARASATTLTVDFISCLSKNSAPDVLSVFDRVGSRELSSIQMTTMARGVESAKIDLPAGYYAVRVGRLPCSAAADVLIAPFASRTVVLKGEDRLSLTEGLVALGGAVPQGIRVSAHCQNAFGETIEYQATVESGNYFFDAIQARATCEVRFYVASSATPAYSFNQLFESKHLVTMRDVTFKELSSR